MTWWRFWQWCIVSASFPWVKNEWMKTHADTYFHASFHFHSLVFPRTTGLFIFFANMCRHLWELSHGDPSSVGGLQWRLLCQLLLPGGWRHECSFSLLLFKERVTELYADPNPPGRHSLSRPTQSDHHHPHRHLNKLRMLCLLTVSDSFCHYSFIWLWYFRVCISSHWLIQISHDWGSSAPTNYIFCIRWVIYLSDNWHLQSINQLFYTHLWSECSASD